MSYSQKPPTLSRHDTEKHGFVLEKQGSSSANQNVNSRSRDHANHSTSTSINSSNQHNHVYHSSLNNSLNQTNMSSINYHPSSYSMWTKGRRSTNKSTTSHLVTSTALVTPVNNVGTKGKILLFLIVAFVLVLQIITKVAFTSAPICTTLTVFLLIILSLFVFTEKEKKFFFHHRLSREQTFWTIWVSLLTATLIFSPDSWLNSWFHHRPWLGIFVIIVVVVLWGDYEIQTTMNTLRLPQTVVPVDELRDSPESVDARELVSSLTSTLQSQSSSNLFRRGRHGGLASVEAVFRACDTLTVNYLIQKVGMTWLLHVVGDYAKVIIEILVSERLHELDVVSKACIIDALQSLRLTSFDGGNRWLTLIFESTEGICLTQLKCLLDTKGNVQSLHKLQYQDLGGTFLEKVATRDAILQHITKEALQVQSATMAHIPASLRINETELKYRNFDKMSNSYNTASIPISHPEPVLTTEDLSMCRNSSTTSSSLFQKDLIVPESSSNSSDPDSDDDSDDHLFEPLPLNSLLLPIVHSPPQLPYEEDVMNTDNTHSGSDNDDDDDTKEKVPLLQKIPIPNMTKTINTPSSASLNRWRGGLDVTPHIAADSPNLKAVAALQLAKSSTMASGPLVKIQSDVDDTLFSSGGKFPNGIDRMYRYHELYPGVICFLKEVDLGFDAVGEWTKAHGRGNVAFLSARPHVYKDKAERKSYQTFEKLRKQHGLHAVPTLLPGSQDAGISMLAGDYKPLAMQKYANFKEFISLYPEFSFVFIGDNGQADVLAAELMLENHKTSVALCLIHLVQPLELTPGYTYERARKWTDLGMVFFHTYIGAAVHCCQLRLVHPRAVRRIVRAAQVDFATIHKEDQFTDWNAVKADPTTSAIEDGSKSTVALNQPFLREVHRTQLNGDILLAKKLLSHPQIALDERVAMIHHPELCPEDEISMLEFIPAIRTIPNGVIVTTKPDFGLLVVTGFDSALNVYSLELLSRRNNKYFILPTLQHKKSKKHVRMYTGKKHPLIHQVCHSTTGNDVYKPFQQQAENTYGTHIYAHESNLTIACHPNINARVVTLFGTGILVNYDACGFHTVSIRDINGKQIAECHLKACDFDFIAAAKGDVVRTIYGAGLVIDYRVKDTIYVVALPWGTAYLNPDSILGFEESSKSTCAVM